MSITDTAGEAAPGRAAKRRPADLGLSRLRSFICLAEELHFGRAARRLHISQPALSQQMARLEKDLAIALLLRTKRAVWLTPAGREFLRGARAAVRALDETTDATRRRAGSRSPLVLSHVPHGDSAAEAFVAELSALAGEQLLHAGVRVVRHTPEEQVRALREGGAVLGVRPADGAPGPLGLVSAHVTLRAAPDEGGSPTVHRLRLSWPEWASPAEIDRLVALARGLARPPLVAAAEG